MECWGYLVLLVSCIAASQTSPTTQSPRSRCNHALRDCTTDNLSAYMTINSDEEVVQLLGDRERLSGFATAMRRAGDCERTAYASPNCARENGRTMSLQTVADFLEFPGAIDNLVNLSTSECIVNEDKLREVEASATVCIIPVQSARLTGRNMCGALGQFVGCIKRRASNICGSPAGQLIQMIWDFVRTPGYQAYLPHFIPFDIDVTCERQIQVARRLAQDVLPLWQKLRR